MRHVREKAGIPDSLCPVVDGEGKKCGYSRPLIDVLVRMTSVILAENDGKINYIGEDGVVHYSIGGDGWSNGEHASHFLCHRSIYKSSTVTGENFAVPRLPRKVRNFSCREIFPVTVI